MAAVEARRLVRMEDLEKKPGSKILDILRKHHAHATFFVLGTNAENEPSLLRRIVAAGHELGSHPFTHGNLTMMSYGQIKLEPYATQV